MKIKIAGQLWDFKENMALPYSDANEVYIDGFLYANLEIFAERLIQNFDTWINITGDEGDGKSALAKIIASTVQSILLNDFKKPPKIHLAWTPPQFKDAVFTSEHFDIVIFDEAMSGLSARRAMTLINTSLLQMAAKCRKKNLFVIIVMPAFHDLDKSIAIHRTRALINVYTGDKFKRGFFSYYTKDQKRMLYVDGKKYYNMQCVQPEFRGRYVLWSVFNEEMYEENKDRADSEQTEQATAISKWILQRNAAYYLLEQAGMTHAAISEKISQLTQTSCARNSISDAIRGFAKTHAGDGKGEL